MDKNVYLQKNYKFNMTNERAVELANSINELMEAHGSLTWVFGFSMTAFSIVGVLYAIDVVTSLILTTIFFALMILRILVNREM